MGNLADRIKLIRRCAGLSQERFAEIVGAPEGVDVTRGAVGNWELGGGISRTNLAAIADKFGVSLDWLEFGRGDIPQNLREIGRDGVDAARKLIADKLVEHGLSMKDASKAIGRNEAYVHQFLKRGIPAELVERGRENLGQLLGISPDNLRGPSNPLPSRINGGSRSICSEELNEELRERCRGYERALRKIVSEESNSSAAEIARAALRLYE